MTKIQETINDISQGLYEAGIINVKTLRELKENEIPVLHEYTPEEIQAIRKKQKLSQAVFAKYLNVSPATVRSLEQGKRQAHGAILKLLNMVEREGVAILI